MLGLLLCSSWKMFLLLMSVSCVPYCSVLRGLPLHHFLLHWEQTRQYRHVSSCYLRSSPLCTYSQRIPLYLCLVALGSSLVVFSVSSRSLWFTHTWHVLEEWSEDSFSTHHCRSLLSKGGLLSLSFLTPSFSWALASFLILHSDQYLTCWPDNLFSWKK